MENRKSERVDEQKQAARIYGYIIKGLIIAGIALFFIHWGYSLCLAVILLWSAYFYERGRTEWVCDEYEVNGYPSQGLYRMFKSWIVLGVLLAVILIIIFTVKFTS